jgi:hypothetical protein
MAHEALKGRYGMQIGRGRWVRLLILGLGVCMLLPVACSRKSTVEEHAVARISVEEVKERLDSGEAITFVDSRSAGAWAGAVAKIPGAIRVPPNDIPDDISDIPRGNPVVVYCT